MRKIKNGWKSFNTHTIEKFTSQFFQAEDGIRDLRMSRGLGDVYKRQL
ncbi:hypothetical protein JMUB7525_27550 [Staphylococcus aureus]